MVAGEYAVLAGGLAVSIAVPSDLRVAVDAAPIDRVSSEALALDGAPLSHPQLRYVAEAVAAVRWVLGQDEPLALEIRGSMKAAHHVGAKLGLGSSAAICVGVVRAAWRHYRETLPTLQQTFRLAYRAHFRAQQNLGSGYDVATQAAAQTIAYRRPSVDRLANDDPRDFLDQPWPELQIERLAWPSGLGCRAIYCGQSADTRALVRATPAASSAMHQAAVAVAAAWRAGQSVAVLEAIARAERAFRQWATAHQLAVDNQRLDSVRRIIDGCGGVARVSGAGGGDSVLAFFDDETVGVRLTQAAHKAQLPLFDPGSAQG